MHQDRFKVGGFGDNYNLIKWGKKKKEFERKDTIKCYECKRENPSCGFVPIYNTLTINDKVIHSGFICKDCDKEIKGEKGR